MRELNVGGVIVLVDDEDYTKVSALSWWIHKPRPYIRGKLKGKNVYMHRFVLGILDPKLDVDHINGIMHDNRKCNLRVCSRAENLRNKRKMPGSSKYKGVTKVNRKWAAQITFNYKHYNLGTFNTEEEAARAYDRAAIELFGEFSKPNNIRRA